MPSITDNGQYPEYTIPGNSFLPFSNITITPDNLDELLTIAVSLSANGNASNLGSITDPSNPSQGQGSYFSENIRIADLSDATTLIRRLAYTPPNLTAGQSAEVRATLYAYTPYYPYYNSFTSDSNPIIDTVTAPLISGTVANQLVPPSNALNPFATTKIIDNDFNQTAQDTATIKVTDGGKLTDDDGTLTGPGISYVGVGTYSISGVSSSDLTKDLQGATLNVPDPSSFSGTRTVSLELDVKDVPPGNATAAPGFDPATALASKDTTTSIIEHGIKQDAVNHFHVADQDMPGEPYNGPVPGIEWQYIVPQDIITHNLNVSSLADNVFIKTGSGDDALDMNGHNGRNVLDGSTGSNFMTAGGSGYDEFYVDDRNAPAAIWTTVRGMGPGDNATIWGITQDDFAQMTTGNDVLPIAPGLDFSLLRPGHSDVNLTLTDFHTSDLPQSMGGNGRLGISFGTVENNNYMQIHANS